MKISVVIPNHNGFHLLKKNLAEVLKNSSGYEIILVDDASTDGSADYVSSNYPSIKIVRREKNEGFIKSVNEGVKKAKGDLVYLLNTDIIPKKDYIKYLLPYFQNEKTFAVGSLQESIEKEGIILRGRGIGSFQKGFLMHARGEVDKTATLWVSGGAGLFRKNIWEKLGGLNKLYSPFYWEDIDISYRALKAGYNIYFESRSKVIHEQAQSSIRTKYSPNYITVVSYRNQILFVWINITDTELILEHILNVAKYLIKSLISLRFDFIEAFFKALMSIDMAFRSRRSVSKMGKVHDKEIFARYNS